MSILLNYKGFLIALTDVTMNLGGKLQTQALGGATQEQINVATQPIPYSSINLYNPESGLAFVACHIGVDFTAEPYFGNWYDGWGNL